MIIFARVPRSSSLRRIKLCTRYGRWYLTRDGHKPERVFTLATYTEQVGYYPRMEGQAK